jgi:hypothetical protein
MLSTATFRDSGLKLVPKPQAPAQELPRSKVSFLLLGAASQAVVFLRFFVSC